MLRFRKFWLSCGIAFLLLVIYLSLTRHPLVLGRLFGVKIGHFIAYCWLMLWYTQLFKSRPSQLVIGIALCGMGVALEYAQGLTTYRTFAYSDMRDNAIGIAVGFLLSFTALRNALEMLESRVGPR